VAIQAGNITIQTGIVTIPTRIGEFPFYHDYFRMANGKIFSCIGTIQYIH
jgi:hypothetical protein